MQDKFGVGGNLFINGGLFAGGGVFGRGGREGFPLFPWSGEFSQWSSRTLSSATASDEPWYDLGTAGDHLYPLSTKEPVLENAGSAIATITYSVDKLHRTSGQPLGPAKDFHKSTASHTKIFRMRCATNSTLTNATFLDTRGPTATNPGCHVRNASSSGGLQTTVRNGTTNMGQTTSSTVPLLSSAQFVPWHLYIETYDHTTNTLYRWMDGKLIHTASSFLTGTEGSLHSSATLTIGALGNGTGAYTGQITDMVFLDDYIDATFVAAVACEYFTALYADITPQADLYELERPYFGVDPAPLVTTSQSHKARYRTADDAAGQIAYDARMKALGKERRWMAQRAVGGQPLLKSNDGGSGLYWINDDSTLARGTLYTNLAVYHSADYFIGTAHYSDVAAGNASKAELIAGYTAFVDFLEADFANFEALLLEQWLRATGLSIGVELDMIEAVQDLYADPRIIELPSQRQFPLTDFTHLTEEGCVAAAILNANCFNSILDGDNKHLPSRVTAAVQSGSDITCTVAHRGDNTDFTVPSGAEKGFYVVDSVSGGISPSSVTKNSATEFVLHLPSTPTGTVKVYTCDNGLDATAPEVVMLNGSFGIALGVGYVTAT